MFSGKRYSLAAVAIAIAVLVGGSVFVGLESDPWVSRKGVPRDFGEVEFFTRGETPIHTPARALRTSEVTRKETEDKLSFIWKVAKQRSRRVREGRTPPRFDDDDRQIVSLPDGGRIRLAWATMGYQPGLEDFPTNEPFSPTEVTVRGDTWEALDEAAFRRFQEEELGLANSMSPHLSEWGPGRFSLSLWFLHEGLLDFDDASSLEVMNLDTGTRVDGMSGSSLNSFRLGRLHALPAVEVFYPARLAVGFDIAYGPFEEARLPIRPGSSAELGDLEIGIIAMERFSYGSVYNDWLVERSGSRETRSMKFELDPDRAPQTTIVFSLSPPELGRFCDVVLVDRDGERETQPLRRAYLLSRVTTDTFPEDLDEMILRYRPNQARVVFELPPLRGTPEINRDVDNLFDVTIPHLEATQPFTLERTVAHQAGVRFSFPDATFPEDYFPHYFENATLGELLEEYLAHHPDGSRVRLDESTHRLFIPEPFNLRDYVIERWTDLRKWVGF